MIKTVDAGPQPSSCSTDFDVSSIELSSGVEHVIRKAIAGSLDREVCGFMFGHTDERCLKATLAVPATNVHCARTNFAISQAEFSAAMELSSDDRSLIGIYHNHFGRAHLSTTDRKGLVTRPLVWLIVGMIGCAEGDALEWRCYRAAEGKVKRLKVRFQPKSPE